MDEYRVIIFGGSKQTIQAERLVREAGFDTRSIPCPRHLSLNCGVVLRIKREDEVTILKLLDEKEVSYDSVEEASE